MINQQVGKYRIQKFLSSGGMSDVYLAVDSSNNQLVAVKIIKPEIMLDAKLVKRFEREIDIVRRFRHPNLIRLYQYGRLPSGQYYMAMEYVDGGNLADRLAHYRKQGQPMPANEALFIARRVAGAMAHAHQAGAIHRDLKPANILMRRNGEPVVTDFGVAALLGATPLTGHQERPGTLQYMAPEQLRGEKADQRADIYAIGLLLYELLAGRRPIDGNQHWATIVHQRLYEQIPLVNQFRPELSGQVAAVIHTCLQPDRNRRYATARALAEALDVCLYIPTIARPRPAVTSRGFGVIVVGALIVIAILIYLQPPSGTVPPTPSRMATVAVAATQPAGEEGTPASATPVATSTTGTRVETAVPVTQTRVPQSTPTAIAATFTLISPLCVSSHQYGANGQIRFEWTWDGTLERGEYLEVRTGRGGSFLASRGIVAPPGGSQLWTQSGPVGEFAPDGPGEYQWQVIHMAADSRSQKGTSEVSCFTVSASSALAADRDGDGVADNQDQCPDTPAGADADPNQPGCPAPPETPPTLVPTSEPPPTPGLW